MGSLDLSVNHPLYVRAQQERARLAKWTSSAEGQAIMQQARERATPIGQAAGAADLGDSKLQRALGAPASPRPRPAIFGNGRPDSSGGLSINQNVPSSTYLMRGRGANPFNHNDENFNRASQSGIEGRLGHDVLTGGGPEGSLEAGLLAKQRGESLMRSLPGLAPMLPFKRGSSPGTAAAFKDVDAQVNAIAARERQGADADDGGDPLVAALRAGPARPGTPPGAQGVTSTAQAAASGPIVPPAALGQGPMPGGPGGPGPLSDRRAFARTAGGGQLQLPLLGSPRQIAAAQLAIEGPKPMAGANNPPGVNPPVPIGGILGGVAGISDALSRIFGGAGGGAQVSQGDRIRQAHEELARRAERLGNPLEALNIRLVGEKAAGAAESPRAQLDALELQRMKELMAMGPVGSALLRGLSSGNMGNADLQQIVRDLNRAMTVPKPGGK